MKRRLYILMMVIVTAVTGAKAQNLAVHTNLLFDGLLSPSLGIDIGVGKRSTINIDAVYSNNPYGTNMSLFGLMPEYRYWFGNRRFDSFFIGAGGVFDIHNIEWKGKKYEGQAYGIGPTFGYGIYLSQHCGLIIHAGCGVIGYNQKEYHVRDNYYDYTQDGSLRANSWGYTLLPTNIGVTFVYIIQ